MILSIKISDETYKKYAERDTNMPQRAIERALSAFEDLEVGGKYVILRAKALDACEKAFGSTISADNVEDFTSFITKLSSARVEGHDIKLSKRQLKKVEDEARFFHRTFDAHLEEIAERALTDRLGV